MSKTEFDETIWGPAPKETRSLSKKKTKRKKSKNKGGSKLALVLFFLVLFAVCAFLGYIFSNNWLGQGINPGEEQESPDNGKPVASKDEDKEAILLLGVDRRGNEAARADTIMVALVDKKSASVKLLSIPRDTYTQVSGHGRTKINHAYAYGGEKLMLETVNKLLGLNIEKYVVADFQGFVNIVDILGGVRMNVEKRMYYPPEGIDLMPGDQVLDGDKALQYVRFRSDGKGDIGRVARQQEFLKQLADKALQISTVWKIPDLIKEASRSIETNLSIPEMISLGNTFKNIDTSAIEAKTLPGWPDYINEISYWIPDEIELEKIFN